ncbi:putative spermidine/putrescine transport system permease protein [Tistlia consotensis]|uniref:Putative spermidine/putrescine transport system permease protein n=1 Tax=Tistlia consotensis USBA 355 TaxID=560819 RepID=A0A1Y6C1V3_9PROT|nr:ABC transporter permease [Tistlia consotensis]SMF32162.1 putative spermidine/putrescine transport system permease protein [Tistlia consotensis USBA 355]SNR68229.1 putative spermidine/putrescine transport system permease protein [Tistlia consotensis]
MSGVAAPRGHRPLGLRIRRALAGAGLPAYAALALLFLQVPVIIVVLASITTTSYLTVPPVGATLKWYWQVLGDESYRDAIVFSLALAVVATLVALALGTAAAYALTRRRVPGAEAISAALMAPLVFPAVVVAVALLQYYTLIGVRGSFAGLAIAHVLITLPYVVRSVLASIAGADPALEEAARTLGADGWTAFRLVTLPLIKPGLVAGAIFSFIVSFDNVPVSIFLVSVRHTTLPVKIFTAVEHGIDPGIAAISTLLILATGFCLVVAERWVGFHRFA